MEVRGPRSTPLRLCSVIGCKATPVAPDSGFLNDPHKLTPISRVPFDRSYWDPRYDPSYYTELQVMPVSTRYVMAENIWEQANAAHLLDPNYKQDILDLGEYMRHAFIDAAVNDPKKHFKIVNTPGPHTLILESALVQIVPSKAMLNAAGIVFWEATATEFAGKSATNSEDLGKGVVAIEVRLRDGGTGKVVGMFADRERPKFAVIDLRSITWWHPIEGVMRDWANQFVEVCNTASDKSIERPLPFELLLW